MSDAVTLLLDEFGLYSERRHGPPKQKPARQMYASLLHVLAECIDVALVVMQAACVCG